jgi:hypothetical protein
MLDRFLVGVMAIVGAVLRPAYAMGTCSAARLHGL